MKDYHFQAVKYTLTLGETLNGVIRKVNCHDVTKEELELLLSQFKKLNTQEIFKPGMTVFIPILLRHGIEKINKNQPFK